MSGDGGVEILLADDDPVVRAGYAQVLRAQGWGITLAADGFEAMQAARHGTYDVFLIDTRMPYRNGADVIRMLATEGLSADARVIVLAQPGDSDVVDLAMRAGAEAVFDKTVMGPRDVAAEIGVLVHGSGRVRRTGAQSPDTVPDGVKAMADRFRSRGGRGAQLPRPPRSSRPPARQEPRGAGPSHSAGPSHGGTPQRGDPLVERSHVVDPRVQAFSNSGSGLIIDRGLPPNRSQPESDRRPPPGDYRQAGPGDDYGRPPPPEDYGRGPARHGYDTGPAGPTGYGNDAYDTSTEPDGPYNTILNKNMGEAGRLAQALGLPPDFGCPVCRSSLVLKLWPDPATEGGVTGHFFCPGCTG